ncbi:hypothetical protein [Flaviflexus equikiangi]|uniref:Uncharacterized protein n=1 Tax=Flaviflexus equikiangi TaxID=2758573 RepID=A0ABS2TF87_9ACTO|nr:hypothetical protein [Flaviflexus equikiangi]MBM9433315.1 hypothetical protein [Flaviflexus equikiangi]
MNHAQRLAHARDVLHRAETASGLSKTEDKEGWQTPEVLSTVLPALTPGVLAVVGSSTILLALAGHASSQGAWVALVGLPLIGWGAAVDHGLDLTRTAHIPAPGARAAEVLTALADGFDILVVGDLALTARDQRALAQRVRTRDTTILAAEWSTGASVLRVESAGSSGYDAGVGHLASTRFTVSSGSRHATCLWTAHGLTSAPRLLRAVASC